MLPPPISVALATYNGERYLADQLASIAAQTTPPAELVVSDDGSTDGTVRVLESFAETAPFPVRIVRNDVPVGYGDNFLRAAALCTSDWIAFSDQDDVWLPHKLATVAAAAATSGAVLVAHSADLVGEDLSFTGRRFPDHTRRVAGPLEGRPLQFLSGFTLAFDRTLLDGVSVDQRPRDVNTPDRQLAHDQLVPALANVFGRTAFLPDALVLYRRHGMAVTGEQGSGDHATDLRRKATVHLQATAADYRLQADIAEEYAVFLDTLGLELTGSKEALAHRGADYYRHYARALRGRGRVHDRQRSRWRRVRAWAGAVGAGLYGRIGEGAGLGWRACAKDLALGVVR